jgi:hypothetical protein
MSLSFCHVLRKPIHVNDYPAVKRHLDNYWNKIEHRSDQGDTPYNLRNCAYMDDFYKQKIVWGNLNLKASYSIAPEGMFINAPCPLIVSAEKYLLAILNSKLADYYIRNLGVTRNGGYFEYKPMFIEQLPVLKETDRKQIIIDIVDKILESKEITQKFDKQLDEEIYRLYNLSMEEINFIESTIK